MPGGGGQISQRLLKGAVGSLFWIGPPGTVVLVPLVVGRAKQRAVPFPGEGLPVQVVGGGGAALAGALAAPVLMDDDSAQPLRLRRYPKRLGHAQFQLAGIGRSFIAHAVIRWHSRRQNRLGQRARRAQEQKEAS